MSLTEFRVGVELVVGGDLGDPSREVDILLGHPFDDVFGALVVAVDGVVGDQLEGRRTHCRSTRAGGGRARRPPRPPR